MHKIDAPHATIDNEFTDGNPSTGIEATELIAKFFNTVQRELVAVVEAAGLTLSDEDDGQVIEAISALLSYHATLTAPHGATPDATAERLVIRDANGRASFAIGSLGSHPAILSQFVCNSSEDGWMRFPTGFTIQWGTCAGSEDAWGIRSYPIAFSLALAIVGVGSDAVFGTDVGIRVDLYSPSQYRVYNNAYFANTIRWIALGIIS